MEKKLIKFRVQDGLSVWEYFREKVLPHEQSSLDDDEEEHVHQLKFMFIRNSSLLKCTCKLFGCAQTFRSHIKSTPVHLQFSA